MTPNISGAVGSAAEGCCDTQYFSQYAPGMQGNEPEGGGRKEGGGGVLEVMFGQSSTLLQ